MSRAEKFTLEEARQELRREACSQDGHSPAGGVFMTWGDAAAGGIRVCSCECGAYRWRREKA